MASERSAREVSRLSPVHESIINWLVLNPHRSMRECADTFNYTQSWLSSLVNSDIFKAALHARQTEIASRVAQSIPARMAAVTNVALDKLADKLEKSEDGDFILEVADKMLHRQGFAPQSSRNPGGPPAGSPTFQQNNFLISSTDLAAARALLQTGGGEPSSAALLSRVGANALESAPFVEVVQSGS